MWGRIFGWNYYYFLGLLQFHPSFYLTITIVLLVLVYCLWEIPHKVSSISILFCRHDSILLWATTTTSELFF